LQSYALYEGNYTVYGFKIMNFAMTGGLACFDRHSSQFELRAIRNICYFALFILMSYKQVQVLK